jgi:cobalt-zinc-cadmium efflux system outer membrane protein
MAQDTSRISIQMAEKQFLEKNLQLLAEKYNIDIARAAVIQAKLYNNPNISFSGALYNQEQKKILDISNTTGQYSINVQQLIILAGKCLHSPGKHPGKPECCLR